MQNNEGQLVSYSWKIISDYVAVKQCDKSFFLYNDTGIPKDTINFWGIADLTQGQRKEIILVYSEKEYSAYFSIIPNDRARMNWHTDLQNEISKYSTKIGHIYARYFKISDSKYILEMFEDSVQMINPLNDSEEAVIRNLELGLLKQIACSKATDSVREKSCITTGRRRDPYIAEYTKRRALGVCQLCGNAAPFCDKNGIPYLESHHIEWLSAGGADSIDNTIALCPNCHRKMHIINDSNDIELLKKKAKDNN